MKGVLLAVVGSMVLMGCTGPGMKLSSKGQFYNLESSSTGALGPSLKTLITFACVPEEGKYESVKVDEELAECHGRFVVLDKNQAQQAGYMTGVFSSAINGMAFAGGMYLLGPEGIAKSGDDVRTTNNNDTTGGTANSSSLGVGTGGSATSAAQGGAGGNGYGFGGAGGKGGSVNYGKHRR